MNFTQHNHNKGNVNNTFAKEEKSMIQPRNDMVLVRIIKRGESRGGIAMPDISAEGTDYIVEAVGPKVVGLEVGDKILPVGRRGVEWDLIPEESDLFILKESNIPIIYKKE